MPAHQCRWSPIAAFAVNYIHSSPTALTSTGFGRASDGSPIVDVKLTTVGQVGTGPHPNWVGYLPKTFIKVPPNATAGSPSTSRTAPAVCAIRTRAWYAAPWAAP
ncbi:MAG: hypothetical protein JF887_07635 [Candidatus Dormibacteraeota bacterium]|uniref:Uncharacterized protein n=1 Tax=Candidatus Amunia macphersoniae TaxID=3127014 RepID=A0A934KM02_9BACT|nr:hypothetical protein [Candidatus Dormibacteraeota bacterium]